MRNYRIRIFQPIVPEYRKALFEGLWERYGERIDILAAKGVGQDISYPLAHMRYDYEHPLKRIGPFVWQKGFSLKGLIRGDVIVICGDVHQLSSLWIAFYARWRGIKVVWWGHHVSAQARKILVLIRLWIARHLSNIYLCYTDAGIQYLLSWGFKPGRVFATGNTIDLAAVTQATMKWSVDRLVDFKTENGMNGKRILLFCGVLRWKVRVDVLLRAFKDVLQRMTDVHLVIIGGGDKLEEWRHLALKLDVDSSVTWVGELRGQEALAPWFLSSDVFVYPGRIGLSLIHAFAFGLPVILNDNRNNHGPEYVAFHPGENGVAFRENDISDLSGKIQAALNDPGKMASFGERGKAFVVKNYSMIRMVERYAEALEAAATLDSE